MRDLLAALQHGDSAFPSGGFAFSNGLEAAHAAGAPLDPQGLQALLEMLMRHRWAVADRVIVSRAHRAGSDMATLVSLDGEAEAMSVCAPLREGSRRNGAALIAAHQRMGTPGAAELRGAVRDGAMKGHLPVVQGALWRQLGMSEETALGLSAYGAAAACVTAAIRLGRIGAIAAQPVLSHALALAAELAAEPVPQDAAPASFVPFIEIAAARHVEADLRLFAS